MKKQILVVLMSLAGIGSAFAGQSTGAGASFPAPLYAKWSESYVKATSNQINYQSVGSGAGIKQIKAGTVDFGASDMPLKAEDLSAEGLVQFPAIVGGVVPVTNLPGITSNELKLDGAVLADIYLGKVTVWNDAKIVALNPGKTLPSNPISVVRRADGSGTTFLFASYLSSVSAEWKEKVGASTAVNWPVGNGGKGNEGVAALVAQTPYSIGYVEFTFLKNNAKLDGIQLKSAKGDFVKASPEAFVIASSTAKFNEVRSADMISVAKEGAWPITGASYVIVKKNPERPEQACEGLKFFDFSLKNGAKDAGDLGYIPLAPETQKLFKSASAEVNGCSIK